MDTSHRELAITAVVPALAAGLALPAALRSGTVGWIVVGLGVLGVALLLLRLGAGLLVVATVTAVAAVGAAWSLHRLALLDRDPLAPRIGQVVDGRVVVVGQPRPGPFGTKVAAELDGHAVELVLTHEIQTGDVLAVHGRLARPRGPSNGFDERTWLAHQGIHELLRVQRAATIGRRGGLLGAVDSIRRRARDALAAGGDGEPAKVAQGLLLGGSGELSLETQEDFRASGLQHILAVSGSNIALLAGIVLATAWLVGLSRAVAHAIVIPTLIAYALVVGPGASVVRASVAGVAVSTAWLVNRPVLRWHVLALGAAIVIGLDPWAVVEPGFQLSFVAVAAIYALAPRLSTWLDGRPCPAVLRVPIAVSVACTVATAPISWWHFDRASLVGSVPANLLALPLVAPALWLAVLAVVAYPIAPVVTVALDVAIDGLAETLIRVAQLGAWLDGRGAIVLALVGLPLTLALRTRHPIACIGPGLAVIALAVVCAPLLVAHPVRAPPASLRVTFLDVGQGNATLIEAPGLTVLDDAGPPAANVARTLRTLSVRRLDLLVLSHPQSDHVGGAADVLAGVTVGRVLDPGLPSSEPFELAALARARERGVPVTIARGGLRVRAGPVELRVLGPRHVVPGEDPNRAAIVLEVRQGACRFLLPADAESDVTSPLELPQATVLEVAHHGSADPGLAALLRRVRPREAVISVGKDNSYGHPAASTLETLTRAGVRIRRTDREGDVSLACPSTAP